MRWFFGKKEAESKPRSPAPGGGARHEVPLYSRLIGQPTQALPDELVAKERGEEYKKEIAACSQWLESQPPPPDDAIVLTSLASGKKGLVTLDAGGGDRAALYFSSPLRAADYMAAVGGASAGWQYLALTVSGALRMMRDLERAGITSCCLDRCPRCDLAVLINLGSLTTPALVRTLLQIAQGTAMARTQLYHSHALSAARAGRMEEALDVALESVGHVTFEDANTHFLIGQLGIALRDPLLVREARTMLEFIRAHEFAERLDRVASAGTADFSEP